MSPFMLTELSIFQCVGLYVAIIGAVILFSALITVSLNILFFRRR